ncbi:hypothetical protein AUK22_01710 [bacterium CG2_30_54_10]|nr:MAG: hypothetical protein AUK22_01710 [bacterium CG2_30_54_10]
MASSLRETEFPVIFAIRPVFATRSAFAVRSSFANRLASVLFAVLFLSVQVDANDAIMPLKDVKVGMKGFGKTVIHGRDIETFNVEVMGVLSNNKLNENILISGQSILVKVSGQVIQDAGGIAAGMSGSPVYINGKIIGGLSSGWVMTDHTVGLVTPIEEMLDIWDYPLTSSRPVDEKPVLWTCSAPLRLGGKIVNRLWEVSDDEDVSRSGILPGEPVFLHAATPVFIQGLSDKFLGILNSHFKNRHLQAVPIPPGMNLSAVSSKGNASETLEPGSAIGVQLARGDINLTTLGTLTYRDGKRILAFAHPFLKKGNVSFLMTGTHIYHSFSSVQMPFKIGAPTEMLGVITQDREKGISGEVGRFPTMVPVQLEISDKDIKRSRSINYQVVRDPAVFISVIESTLQQAIEEVIDRDGEGTAQMVIALECANSAGKQYQFRRENLFHSKSDIVGSLIEETTGLLGNIMDSDLEEVSPTRLMLKLEVEKQRRTMNIEKVEVKNHSITPGGILEAWVTIRPYREKSLVRKAKLPIPHDIGKENLTLSVFGLSGRVEDSEATGDGKDGAKSGKENRSSDEKSPETFDAAMSEWVNSPKNSDLLFQLTAEGEEVKKIKLNNRDLEIQPTNLVVQGRVETTISLSEE